MIQKQYGNYYLICDNCGTILSVEHSFDKAVDAKKDKGVKSRKIDGRWIDVCVDCQVNIFKEQRK